MWKSIFATVTISLGVASVFTLATEQHRKMASNDFPKNTTVDYKHYQKPVRLIPIPPQPQQPDWYAATKYPINTNDDAPPLPTPEVDKPVDVPPPPAQEMKVEHKVEKAESDVCTRHGMRKVYYGKRWRCR